MEVYLLDLQKAFDSMNHKLLNQKVKAFGLGGGVKTWMTQSLQGRSFGIIVQDRFRTILRAGLDSEAESTRAVP